MGAHFTVLSGYVLSGHVLSATEDELRELLTIVGKLPPDSGQGAAAWLLNWVQGKWQSIIESPGAGLATEGPATPGRVINFLQAYTEHKKP